MFRSLRKRQQPTTTKSLHDISHLQHKNVTIDDAEHQSGEYCLWGNTHLLKEQIVSETYLNNLKDILHKIRRLHQNIFT